MEFKNKKPVLLLVDIQKAFLDKDYPGFKRNNPNAEFICGEILKKWREIELPVFHVRHSSTNPESKLHESKPGFEFNDFVKPLESEIVLTKKVNSAFIGTDLERILKKYENGELDILIECSSNFKINHFENKNEKKYKYFICYS